MKSNIKVLVFCLSFLLFSLSASADTAYCGPDCFHFDVAHMFFNRPVDEVKSDILANIETVQNDDFLEWKGKHIEVLRSAARVGTLEIIRFILDNWGDMEKEGIITPVYSAAMAGRDDVVEILLEYGVNPNSKYWDNPISAGVSSYARILCASHPRYKFFNCFETDPIDSYIRTLQILWPLIENKEKYMELWESYFYVDLRDVCTQAEIENEWNKFLSLMNSPYSE